MNQEQFQTTPGDEPGVHVSKHRPGPQEPGTGSHTEPGAGTGVCAACGSPAIHTFHTLTVHTLHVRDMGGEKRVQALGDWADFGICSVCADAQLEAIRHPEKTKRPTMARFGLIFAAGVIIAAAAILLRQQVAVFQNTSVFILLGLAAIICGILGAGSAISEGLHRKKAYEAMDPEEARRAAAWEAVLAAAPKKDGDNDLTYIPITDQTLAAKNGDLMILYKLLPDIAVAAHKKIHEGEGDGRDQPERDGKT